MVFQTWNLESREKKKKGKQLYSQGQPQIRRQSPN